MKKMFKNLTGILAVSCLSLSLLAGCGGSSASTEKATSAESAAETGAETDKVYEIGILQLVQHDALGQATQGFEDALTELLGEDHVNFDLQNAQGDTAMCSTIANQFSADKKDLILANATASLQACANATQEIPIVGTSITSFPSALDIEMGEGDQALTGINVTGTNDLTPLNRQAQQLHDLIPDAQHVGILYCSAEVNSVYQAEHIAEAFDELNISYETFTFSDSNDLQSIVNAAVSKCDVLYIPTDNTAASNAGLIDSVARPAGVPIITGDDGTCKGCGLACLAINFYDIGYRAGEMAYDILVNGTDPATIPVEDPAEEALTYVYNPVIAEDLGFTFGEEYTALEVDME
jgi:putative ABC transport system substrate-binding protein